MKNKVITTSLLVLISLISYGQEVLRKNIEAIVVNKNLKLGLAIYDFTSKETVQINATDRFPMQSVFKFPVALALLDRVDKGEFQLTDTILLTKEELYTDLWSPLQKRYPNGAKLPLSEVLAAMVSQSDNSATDLLIKKIGGANTVQQYLNSKGIHEISIKNTEREIQSDWAIQFENWTTPNEMIRLLDRFKHKQLISVQNNDYLWQVMTNTSTGSIRQLLPSDVVIAYKTGNSGAKDGLVAAQNCVGIIELANGNPIAFAIFITASKENATTNLDVIAQIGKAIFDYYSQR